MELLNVNTARVVWLFDIAELNPRGKSLFPEILEWLKEEYHFEKAPATVADLDETKALTFSRGQFQVRDEIFVDVELKLFSDGLVANTQSSTRDTETFLEDVMKTAIKEFSLAFRPDTIRFKLYASEIYVRSVKQLVGINPRLLEFSSQIASLIPGNEHLSYEFAGLKFWPTHPMPNVSIAPFEFERKLNSLPKENKYYSRAPLHTDHHITMLGEFEAAFMA
jgi:hypothetical protein